MAIRFSVFYLCLVCFIGSNVSAEQVSIDQILNGALQNIFDQTPSGGSSATEDANTVNYLNQVKSLYLQTGVTGNVLDANYNASLTVIQSLNVNLQGFDSIGSKIQQTLGQISDSVRHHTSYTGLDVNQWLKDLFQGLTDDAANIIQTNNQELFHIISQFGANVLDLNRQAHQHGADIDSLQSILTDLLTQVSDQFSESVNQRHQQFAAIFQSKAQNGIAKILQVIHAF